MTELVKVMEKNRSNLILIGMPGSGKSTIGVLLAKALGMSFLDTDLEIMRRTGKKLQEILDQEGLKCFLQEEAAAIMDIDCHHTVVATGGSVVLEPEAMERLLEMGSCIFLDVPMPELKRRITNIKSRGIAFAPGQNLEDIYKERLPLYHKYAELTIGVGKDLEDTVEMILTSGFVSC